MVNTLVGIVLSLFGGTEIVYAQEPKVVQIEIVYNWNEERINEEIETKAKEYNVNADTLKSVINCESQGSTTIQSYHYRNGVREESYGLAQWNIPSGNKTKNGIVITKEMAINPEIAIDTMAYYFSKGLQNKWTCWRNM